MVDKATEFASGKVYWAKVIGNPVTNYDGDAREWTFEFAPNDVSFLKKHGLLDRLKEKDYGDVIRLRKSELNKEGEKNEPIRIYNSDNELWDDSLLGNGTEVDVKLDIRDYGKGKKKGMYVSAIRVTNHIPYASNEFGGMDGNKSSAKASTTKAGKISPKEKTILDDFADEDEIPF